MSERLIVKRLKADVMDETALRGMFEGLDQYAVIIKIKMSDRLNFSERVN